MSLAEYHSFYDCKCKKGCKCKKNLITMLIINLIGLAVGLILFFQSSPTSILFFLSLLMSGLLSPALGQIILRSIIISNQ